MERALALAEGEEPTAPAMNRVAEALRTLNYDPVFATIRCGKACYSLL
jgi:hypothetical protein